MACGATCLRMIAKYHGRSISLPDIIQLTSTTREGTNLLGISEAAEKIGFRTLGLKIDYKKFAEEAPLPCIAHWNQSHFLVVHKIKKNKVYVADPAHGLLVYSKEEFLKGWVSDGKDEGIILLFETTPEFYEEGIETNKSSINNSKFILKYLKTHRKAMTQLAIGLFCGSLLQLIFPFLTQSIVDIGVQNRDIGFISLILFAQLMVFFGRASIEIIRNFILTHVSSRINISLVSDFFLKLMKLPISYFDTKMTGDILQRINDNHRIEQFITGSSINTLFSLFNFIIFSFVLGFFSLNILTIFLIGSLIYFVWIVLFLKKRADLDYKLFNQSSENQSKVIELINGMQEIKMQNAERIKRWQWEALQIKLFKLNLKGLTLSTLQNSGSSLINELKNIIITVISAKLVINGEITFGMMLSIGYIIGQLNVPVSEMVSFIQSWQDAKLSLERLQEIHNKENEEQNSQSIYDVDPKNTDLQLKEISFKYEGVGNEYVINDLSLTIPSNKITAIVGSSGSGKTTLMKLMLKFYKPTKGSIYLDSTNLNNISQQYWRSVCGVVMQEGYIFSDTIANNIAVGEEKIDLDKLRQSVKIANIEDLINELPLGFNTKIGMDGKGLSVGQKQRILIARAIYKDPAFLFFDEATSALDTNNEKIIMNNLNTFFKNKTVVVIAHRLSTVKNADQILVLNKGQIIEKGTHEELTSLKGEYYSLVKNQLELGN